MNFYYTEIMKRYITGLIVIITLAVTPMATAKIFKCDGPDGPIFTDRECGPDATNVELADTSGLVGVSDETKTELAEKKAEREAQRIEALKNKGNKTVINNQFTTINTEPSGYWLRRPYRPPGYNRPEVPPATPKPLPSTLGKPRK